MAFAKIQVTAQIRLETGLHIGTSNAFAAIGATDSPVIKDPITNLPIIPGSSIKGKMRSLLSKVHNERLAKKPGEDGELLSRLFGNSSDNRYKMGRLIFRDAFLINKDELDSLGVKSYTEVKFENTIDRITAEANPRQIERAIRESAFAFELIYEITDDSEDQVEEDFKVILDGLKLLELDYLGGSGSRGYGKDDFVLTDAFPYQSSPFLPKPIGFPKFDQQDLTTDVKEVRRQAKMAKKLQFIPLDKFDSYVNGTLFEDAEHAVTNIITKNQPHVDGALYQVSTVRFADKSALYVIATESDLLNELMTSLQYAGIGGKRSSGYGRFDLTITDIPDALKNRLTKVHQGTVMALTTSLPIEKELEHAMETGSYLQSKSSGFAFSTETNENYRKQDLYKFASGSTFCETFTGQIVDVRPLDFPHEVLNYAKPLFFKMEGER